MSTQTTAEMKEGRPKYTPGPWRINRRAATCVEDCNERTIANTATLASNRPGEADRIHEENLANARLAAAAPDLLDAARACIPHMQWVCGHYPPGSESLAAFRMLRDAIARAEGHE